MKQKKLLVNFMTRFSSLTYVRNIFLRIYLRHWQRQCKYWALCTCVDCVASQERFKTD